MQNWHKKNKITSINNSTKKPDKLNNSGGELNITGKFTLAFFGLLLLLGGVATTGWVSLNFVRRETEAAIITSNKLQRSVFRIKGEFDMARESERQFFQNWSNTDLREETQRHVETHQQSIERLLRHCDELQKLLSGVNVSPTLKKSHPQVIAYVEMIVSYRDRFREAVQLVAELGMDETGVIARLDQKSDLLRDTILLEDDPELISLYNQMKAEEKEYFFKRSYPAINALKNTRELLADHIVKLKGFDPERQARSLVYLKDYESIINKIVTLDLEIQDTIQSFEKQSAELSEQLILLSNQEIERARIQIEQTSRAATMLLGAALVLALVLAAAIAEQFWGALKQLETEKEKSERLLLNILPQPIAERLKEDEQIIADNFPEVTVLFADIAGFTPLSASLSPTKLVQLLNEIFSAFDALVEKHDLEKIKTIGDAYMVVGGLPYPQANHAIAIAEMALDMQRVIQDFNQRHQTSLNMRIGIHTGPVVAGVIGTKKFIYDLWGDTVNTASRMESHGIIGNIQMTDSTYQQLRHHYMIEKRGFIEVKGKGNMKTYLLKERKVLPAIASPASVHQAS
jgi:class 3 adenylate cyclase